jgi:hypothetical protein
MYLAQKENKTLGKYSSWNAFWGAINQNDYELSLVKLWDRITWNQGAGCYPISFAKVCFSQAEIDNILKTYMGLVVDNIIPEYNRRKNPENISNIEKTVADKANSSPNRVAIVLYNAWYAAEDGTLPNKSVILPKSYLSNEASYGKTPTGIDTIANTAFGIDAIGKYATYLKYGLYAGAGLLAIGAGLYLYQFLPKAKKDTA